MSVEATSSWPIDITHTRDATGFFDLLSPSSPSFPMSPSSSSSSGCSISPSFSELSLSPDPRPDSWRTAAAEAAAGVHYVLEAFPAPGQTVLGPPFRDAPLKMDAGARLVLLEEEGEKGADAFYVRVRMLDTGEVGYLPAWNVEGALERLARLNMEFNEAATCPAESRTLSRRRHLFLSSPNATVVSRSHTAIAHSHDRCVPFSTRLTFRAHGASLSDDDDEDEDPFDLDRNNANETDVAVYAVRRGLKEGGRRKSVEFATVARPKVFRYPSAALVEAYLGEPIEEDAEERDPNPEQGEGERGEGNDAEEWWWAGWEEHKERSDVFVDCEDGE